MTSMELWQNSTYERHMSLDLPRRRSEASRPSLGLLKLTLRYEHLLRLPGSVYEDEQ